MSWFGYSSKKGKKAQQAVLEYEPAKRKISSKLRSRLSKAAKPTYKLDNSTAFGRDRISLMSELRAADQHWKRLHPQKRGSRAIPYVETAEDIMLPYMTSNPFHTRKVNTIRSPTNVRSNLWRTDPRLDAKLTKQFKAEEARFLERRAAEVYAQRTRKN